MIPKDLIKSTLDSYLSNITWTKALTMFTIPTIDYLVMMGVAREDAEGNEEEILDQLNGEIYESEW